MANPTMSFACIFFFSNLFFFSLGFQVRLNEIVARNVDGGPDWLELYNAGDESVSLAGWSILDESSGVRFYIGSEGCEDSAYIPSGGWMVFYEALDPNDSCGLPFGLAEKGERVSLLDAQGEIVDQTEWIEGYASEGTSWARIPDGNGLFVSSLSPTPGFSNVDKDDTTEDPLQICQSYLLEGEALEPSFVGDIAPGLQLSEISGVASARQTPGVVWVHEDGPRPFLYALHADGESPGTTVANIAIQVSVTDLEDIATAKCPDGVTNCIWLSDTGDNCAREVASAESTPESVSGCAVRENHVVWAIEEPTLSLTDQEANPISYVPGEPGQMAWRFPITYEDAAQHDMESLVVKPDGSQFFLIERKDGCCPSVYASNDLSGMPAGPRDATMLLRVANLQGMEDRPIAGADLHASGTELVVITPRSGAYAFSLAEPFNFSTASLPSNIASSVKASQMEGIAYDYTTEGTSRVGKGLWMVSETDEGEGASPLYYLGCLRV